jgi:hypothetical protein
VKGKSGKIMKSATKKKEEFKIIICEFSANSFEICLEKRCAFTINFSIQKKICHHKRILDTLLHM